jgi:hypothetical protein
MENTNQIVATRTTFDGIQVFLHTDGSVSDRLRFIGRTKLPVATMWRAAADFSLYTHAELPAFIKKVAKGAQKFFSVRVDRPESERLYRSVVTSAGMTVYLRVA